MPACELSCIQMIHGAQIIIDFQQQPGVGGYQQGGQQQQVQHQIPQVPENSLRVPRDSDIFGSMNP